MKNKKYTHCPICKTLCEVMGGEGSTNWYEPLGKDEELEVLRKENYDLKMNQYIVFAAISEMQECFPDQWDKTLKKYKRKYGLK